MPKNYYLVLGIASQASLDDIKEAYRRLVKEFHPDHYGENYSPFLAIQEAYAVLSDPVKRKHHDLSVQQHKENFQQKSFTRNKSVRQRDVEPLIPEQRPAENIKTMGLSRSIHNDYPTFTQLFYRIFSNFNQTDRPKGELLENLNVEVTLTPEESFTGGHVKILIPAEPACPSCYGRGWVGSYECWRCGGEGKISGEYPVIINYPSGIVNNHIVEMPLNYYGINNLYLTVQFRISQCH